MTIRPHTRPARICGEFHDDADLNSRFCYWRGASGISYIHSVYPARSCPPLPGAIYIAVIRTSDGECHALEAGFLDDFHPFRASAHFHADDAELHVHMLASTPIDRRRILQDLRTALFGDHVDAGHEIRHATAAYPTVTLKAPPPASHPGGFRDCQADLFSFDAPPVTAMGSGLGLG